MTRRYAWVLLAWLFLAAPVYAQPVDSGSIVANSSGGGCTAVPPACVVVTFSNQLITTITLQVSGTYTGTTAFEATSSANPLATSAVWFAVTATNLADGSSATGTTSGQTGQFSIPNSGLMGVRVRATAAWTGTAVVVAVRGYAVAWRLSPFFTRVFAGATGTCVTPAYTFQGDTDSGIGWLGANNIAGCAGGATILSWTTAGATVAGTFGVTKAGANEIGFFAGTGASYTTFGEATNTGMFLGWNESSNIATIGHHDSGGEILVGNTAGVLKLQGSVGTTTAMFLSNTAPTTPVACTSPTVTWSNGTATFQIDVGTSCAGVSTLAFTMPAATNGWLCQAINTSAAATRYVEQTTGTTTSVTLTNFVRTTGVAGDFADSADIRVSCSGG